MNNYDSNSKNDSIGFHVSYDYDLSHIYFKEFENENTRIKFCRDSSLFLIGDVTKPFYTKTQLNKMTKAELIKLDEKFELLCPHTYDDTNKTELIDELQNVTIKQYYEFVTNTYSWNAISDKFQHNYYITRGYSQGDSIYIVNVDEDFTKNMKEYIDHIFWDTPIYIRIDVNGVEFTDDELLDDVYKYDKDDVMVKVNALPISDYAKQWLENNLPNTPKYSY